MFLCVFRCRYLTTTTTRVMMTTTRRRRLTASTKECHSFVDPCYRVVEIDQNSHFSYTLSALVVYLVSTCHRICRTIHSQRSVFIKWNKYFVLSSSVHKRQPVYRHSVCFFVEFVVVESCVHCSHFFLIANGGE